MAKRTQTGTLSLKNVSLTDRKCRANGKSSCVMEKDESSVYGALFIPLD